MGANFGTVFVGSSHNTPVFAADNLKAELFSGGAKYRRLTAFAV
jgi:hypothetical protein